MSNEEHYIIDGFQGVRASVDAIVGEPDALIFNTVCAFHVLYYMAIY